MWQTRESHKEVREMIRVKIFGSTPPCAKCKEVERRAKKVAEKYPGKVEVSKFDALSQEAGMYGVMLIPTVVINDRIVARGKVVSEGDLEKLIKKEMER